MTWRAVLLILLAALILFAVLVFVEGCAIAVGTGSATVTVTREGPGPALDVELNRKGASNEDKGAPKPSSPHSQSQ